MSTGGEAEWVLELVAQECHGSMTELEQMPGRELAAGDVIPDHMRQTFDRRSVHVDDHDRYRGGRQADDILRRAGEAR